MRKNKMPGWLRYATTIGFAIGLIWALTTLAFGGDATPLKAGTVFSKEFQAGDYIGPAFGGLGFGGSATGDIITGLSGGRWGRLLGSSGVSGYYIRTQGSGGPAYFSPIFGIASPIQGDIVYYNGSIWTKLQAGASGTYLKTRGVGSNPAWEHGIYDKMTTATYDMSTATGTVSYTGAGFSPQSVIVFGQVNSDPALSVGFANRSESGESILQLQSGNSAESNSLIHLELGGGAKQTAVISSWDTDGVTLSWTKTGSPTGTANVKFLYRR